jgi:hypothetical protein
LFALLAPCLSVVCATNVQALWAAAWLKQHAHMGSFEPGWTYLFEAVYADNMHAVQYCFEGLVLLAAVAPDGRELPAGSAALGQLGAQLGVMVVPTLVGPLGELVSCLSNGIAAPPAESSGLMPEVEQPRTWPPFEGWVLQAADGLRTKLVSAEYTRARAAVAHMHPLTVWDRMRCVGCFYEELVADVPALFWGEMQGILDALDNGFCSVQQELKRQLQLAQGQNVARKLQLLELLGSLAGEHVQERAEKLERLQALLADDGPMQGPSAAAGSATCSAGAASRTLQGTAAESLPPSTGSSTSPGSDRAVAAEQLRYRREDLHRSTPFHAALRYVLQKGSANVASMYLDESIEQGPHAPSGSGRPAALLLLRSLVFDCVRPGQDGTLLGYTPSPGMAQTHAKGWRKWGPTDERMDRITSALPAATSVLRDEDLVEALLRLKGRQLVEAQLVCKAWQKLLLGDPRYAAKVQLAMECDTEEEDDDEYWGEYEYDGHYSDDYSD